VVVAVAVGMVEMAEAAENFGTQVLHPHGFHQQERPYLCKLAVVVVRATQVLHQRFHGAEQLDIKPMLAAVAEAGKVRLYLQAAAVVLVEQAQTAKVQQPFPLQAVVLQRLVQPSVRVQHLGLVYVGS
jgi:uncharacterized paraquat-inducible protein A